ncbi:ThiF family adenylyltransferase [Candidatus Woesearchaeota archaeon]|nr:ThiF family adenylyltransferase [Candidatus Woesearchaeota archaeon]
MASKNNKYSKHELVKQIGDRAKEMRAKTVAVVGLAGVGSVVADMLVRAGIGVRLIDKGRILDYEIQQTSLFLQEDVNKFKAKQAKKRLDSINDAVSIKAFHEELTPINSYLLDSDLVIDCTNDLEVSLIIDKYCSKKKIPMIYCFVSGSQGQVFVIEQGTTLNEISDYVKNKRISEEGIMAATVHTAAGVVASKAAKVLLGIPNEKNMLFFDVWDLNFEKNYARKNK